MVQLAFCFLAGILSVQQLPTLPGLEWLLLGACCSLVLAYCRKQKAYLFLLGVLWAILCASLKLSDRLPESLAGQDIQLQGIIVDLPEHEGNHVRLNFEVEQAAKAAPSKLRLTWYYPGQPVRAGQRWRLTVRLKPPHGNYNPGGFDYERWLFVEGIGATGYVRAKPEPLLLGNVPALANLGVWRQMLADKLGRLPVNADALAMIKALTIGDGDSLTQQQWEVFRKTGTTHLMVISGSHIALIAGLAYLLAVKFWAWTGVMRWSPQKVAACVAMVTALFYAGLTGFSVPAQRAALMVAIAMFAVVRQRNARAYTTLATALFVVLLIDPLIVLSPGFWLSFIAVSLIIYSLDGRLRKPGLLGGSVKINWVTSVGLSPLLLFFFQQVSLISPLANLIAVPIVSLVIVPLALLATLALLVLPQIVGELLFKSVDWALQGLWWLLIKLAELPLATLSHSQPYWWALLFAVPGILLLFAPKGMSSRWLGLVMLFPLLFAKSEQIPPGAAKLTLLDVGQGLSAVVQTANHVLVYDAGAKFSSNSDNGQSVVLPFLRSQGIAKVDTLIISHGDNDHLGGAASIMAGTATESLLTSVPEELHEFTPSKCVVGQSWTWDNVRFKMLSPKLGNLLSDNNNSCVLQIQAEQATALLPGDIEAEAESWLVSTYSDRLKSDIMVAPHHGSQTSSISEFLAAVKPKIILVPAGYRNPFGHPHQEVLDRYNAANARWLTSADSGAILMDLDQNLNAFAWRSTTKRYWHYGQNGDARFRSTIEGLFDKP